MWIGAYPLRAITHSSKPRNETIHPLNVENLTIWQKSQVPSFSPVLKSTLAFYFPQTPAFTGHRGFAIGSQPEAFARWLLGANT